MDAIILAAGLGTRLRPYTEKTPKPLLSVQGRPILDWIIAALPPIDHLVVVVNHLSEQIEDYLRQQTHIRNWSTVLQMVPRGTGDAVMSCKNHVTSDRVLVLNGDDIYSRADLLRLSQRPAGLLAHLVNEPQKFGIVFPREDGTMEKMIEKPPLTGTQLANIGAYLFPKQIFDIPLTLSPRNEYEITEGVSLLAQKAPFYVEKATFWFPIGDIAAWNASQTADLSPAK